MRASSLDELRVGHGHRTYDPTTGTFLQRDPLGEPDGTSVVATDYAYARNDPLNRIDPLGLRSTDDDLLWSGQPTESYPLPDNGGYLLSSPGNLATLKWEWHQSKPCRGLLTAKARFTSQLSDDALHIGNLEQNWAQACFSRGTDGSIGVDHIVISQIQVGCFPAADAGGGAPLDYPDVWGQVGGFLDDAFGPGESCGNAPRSRWDFDILYSDSHRGAQHAVELGWRNPCEGEPQATLATGPSPCFSGRRAYAVVEIPRQRSEHSNLILRISQYPLTMWNTVHTGAEPGGNYSAARTQLSLWSVA